MSDKSKCSPASSLLSVDFVREDGAVEWWGVYALELEEARRWAEHELQLKDSQGGRWRAEIVDGWVDQRTGKRYGSGTLLETVVL